MVIQCNILILNMCVYYVCQQTDEMTVNCTLQNIARIDMSVLRCQVIGWTGIPVCLAV